jgi:hypothetical protein
MPTVDISVPMISKKSGGTFGNISSGGGGASSSAKTNPIVNMSKFLANKKTVFNQKQET